VYEDAKKRGDRGYMTVNLVYRESQNGDDEMAKGGRGGVVKIVTSDKEPKEEEER
jgi:hypothetical protein